MVRTRVYRDGILEAHGFPIADVSVYLKDPSATVWFDLLAPTAEKLAVVSEELGLHPLAVEDVLHPHQRPKVDVYESHLFTTVYTVRLTNGDLDLTEVLSRIDAPTLVVVGSTDRAGQLGARALVDGIAGARLRAVPGSGPAVNVDAPAELVTVLREFLD